MPSHFARYALLGGLLVVHGSARTQVQAPAREIALTFDDLPVASALYANSVPDQSAVTKRLLEALTRNQVPAIGFVNEEKLRSGAHRIDPARVALLQQWIDAGMELGNHSYSHPDFSGTSLKAYERDVALGDSVTKELLLASRRPEPMWFRHPFLTTGNDSVTRRKFERWLADRGYRVAPVTVNDEEYIFDRAYERLLSRGDSAGMARVAAQYVTYMDTDMAYYERLAAGLFGRPIPQVVLLHANVLNADHLDDLIGMLRKRGYTFVSIARATGDPAYASPDRYYGPRGLSWLHRWALAAGKPASFFAGAPKVPRDVIQVR
jgi:peptidoglycan/xylan/chitin deacetylase (PgdA/CDA1 family)